MKIQKVNINSLDFEQYCILAEMVGTFFNSPIWISTFSDYLDVYGIYNEGSRIIGGFQMYNQKFLYLLNYIRNPYFQPHIALFFEKKAKSQSKIFSETRKLLNCIADFLDKNSGIKSITLPVGFDDFIPFYNRRFKVVPNCTYQIKLDREVETILSECSPERRNDFKRAKRDGVETKLVNDYSEVFSIVLERFKSKGKEIDVFLQKKILFEIANNTNSFAYVAYYHGKPASTCFVLYDKTTAYYMFGGYSNKNGHSGAGSLVVWESILHCKKIGLEVFDFEGSVIPQVEKYFSAFGGKQLPLYTINKAPFILECGMKLFKPSQF